MTQKPEDIKTHISKLINDTMLHIQNGQYDQAWKKFDELKRKTHHVVDMMHTYELELKKFNERAGSDDSTVRGFSRSEKTEETAIQKLKRQMIQKELR